MTYKRNITRLGLALALPVLMAGCSPNPKKKCNTCPKWTSEAPAESDHQRFSAKA